MQEIINKTEKPNSISFRYGGTNTDIKIYFKDEKDLVEQLEALNGVMANVKLNMDQIKGKMKEV